MLVIVAAMLTSSKGWLGEVAGGASNTAGDRFSQDSEKQVSHRKRWRQSNCRGYGAWFMLAFIQMQYISIREL
jgi:hypothetical protein